MNILYTNPYVAQIQKGTTVAMGVDQITKTLGTTTNTTEVSTATTMNKRMVH